LVTKNAWKTPPGARPNRDGIVLSLIKLKIVLD